MMEMSKKIVPFSMDESAVALHETFLSMQRAGFTEDQAMQLIQEVLKGALSNAEDTEGDEN